MKYKIIDSQKWEYYKKMQRLANMLLLSRSKNSKINESLLLKKSSYYMAKANSLVIYD
jgi:hypothetical protein